MKTKYKSILFFIINFFGVQISFTEDICNQQIESNSNTITSCPYKTNLYEFCFLCKNNNLQKVKEFVENNAIEDINESCEDGYPKVAAIGTPLYCACKYNALEVVKYLIENGAKNSINKSHPNSPIFQYEDTPLYQACLNNNFEIVKLLVENGAIIKPKFVRATTNQQIRNYLRKRLGLFKKIRC